mmetsp:Transcript_43754/g.51229  ORF Transcript_43754/g.51229 Transcript_43754/m.51229 type:complete len:920 (+) Transcript_43754:242-3001(+)
MSAKSKWAQKKAAEADFAHEKALQTREDSAMDVSRLVSDSAMGGGEDEMYEKKLTKEEKKALAKKKREDKKAAKAKKNGSSGDLVGIDVAAKMKALELANGDASGKPERKKDDGIDYEATELLASEGTICTFALNRKGVDARARDINVSNVTLQHHEGILLDESEVILNHGNRYGLVGRNGCGKSTFMKALGARALPIPESIDIFFLKEEIEPSDTVTALEAVMSVDDERLKLEKRAEELNDLMANVLDEPDKFQNGGNDGGEEKVVKTVEELQEEIIDALNSVYERLDDLDADTAEMRARSILSGLGFSHEMQGKVTKDFSGGWRMRVSLARALFIQPVCLLLDEPTNHLDMEAVIWLEDYLSKWKRILLLVSHSQDFLNNVCSHMIHLNQFKRLDYYNGNYDTFIKTISDNEINQLKQWKWEQDQIKSMKEYIALNQSKNSKQAESKKKVLAKMERAGLAKKPEQEKTLNFRFTDPSHLPPPVLAFHDVSFAYPGCEPLYDNVNFGVDLDSRIALVGPNGAGKTTLVKLISSELIATSGDIRPHGHLKLGRFTQHFVDVLNLEQTPLEFFQTLYPTDELIEQRSYLGRFGVSGKMQVRKMSELSDGQKSRVVLAKLGRDEPHILLLDEPTNHLDMESIDALADAVNKYTGGLVLVSHDMRLISQVANEIWICDKKKITKYKGDIMNFKMDLRKAQGLENGGGVKKLQGDASVKATDKAKKKSKAKKEKPKLEVVRQKAVVASIGEATPEEEETSVPRVSSSTSLLSKPVCMAATATDVDVVAPVVDVAMTSTVVVDDDVAAAVESIQPKPVAVSAPYRPPSRFKPKFQQASTLQSKTPQAPTPKPAQADDTLSDDDDGETPDAWDDDDDDDGDGNTPNGNDAKSLLDTQTASLQKTPVVVPTKPTGSYIPPHLRNRK